MSERAIKYRAYPDEEQKLLFARYFGCCRKIWNLMLEDRISHYEETGESLHSTPAQYKDEYPYLREVDSLALANVQQNLEKAFRNFFRNPKKFGFPNFKSKKRAHKSYTTNNQNGTVSVGETYVHLPKIGDVKAKIHRSFGDGWKIKSATVSQNPDGRYYISVLYEKKTEEPVPVHVQKVKALDYRSDGLYMDSEGETGSSHRYYRESHDRLAKEQRRLSRKEYGSRNYNKQKVKVARVYAHIADQRRDFLNKQSTETANQYDAVFVEDLNMKALANKKFHNGKATNDNGYGMFLDMLEYKLAERGKVLIRVDKWYPSSQLCSCCGARNRIPLSERTYRCPECGLVIDRDLNAAINIEKEGLRMLAQSV